MRKCIRELHLGIKRDCVKGFTNILLSKKFETTFDENTILVEEFSRIDSASLFLIRIIKVRKRYPTVVNLKDQHL
jgi:hypothetical protein